MSRFTLLWILMLLTGWIGFTLSQEQNNQKKGDNPRFSVTVSVHGLSCPFCAYGLEKKLNKLKDISDLKIGVEQGLVNFTLPVQNDTTAIKTTIRTIVKDAGFTPQNITLAEAISSGNEKKPDPSRK